MKADTVEQTEIVIPGVGAGVELALGIFLCVIVSASLILGVLLF